MSYFISGAIIVSTAYSAGQARKSRQQAENDQRTMLAQQAESIAKASGAALATTAAPPPRADKAKFAPTSSL